MYNLEISKKERDKLKITGLLPCAVQNLDTQIKRATLFIATLKTPIDKYMYLYQLYKDNIHLFFKLISLHPKEYLPIVYDPTIGDICLNYHKLYNKPDGIYLCVDDLNKFSTILDNYNNPELRFVCVTSGGRILGLGDIGCNGAPIPIGKLQLYTALARVPPNVVLPICFDFGTNNQKLLEDDLYLGLRRKRPSEKQVDKYVDKFMRIIYKKYPNICVHFEDWNGLEAMRYLEKYRNKYCMFNDDIQGTASVTLAGLFNCLKIKNKSASFKNERILMLGAGSAGLGISQLINENYNLYESDNPDKKKDLFKKNIMLIDSKGLIYKGRSAPINEYKERFQYVPIEDIKTFKKKFPTNKNSETNMLRVIDFFKPTIVIGVSTVGGLITQKIMKKLSVLNTRPIIFSLSNPTSKCEIIAEDAYKYSNGKVIYSAGVQFSPVKIKNRIYYPGQANNFYIYPAIAFTKYITNIKLINDEIFIQAAHSLANSLTKKETNKNYIFPSQDRMTDISYYIYKGLCKYLKKNKDIKLTNIDKIAKKKMYNFNN